MRENGNSRRNRAFITGFVLLTFFCWCPLGYGAYGPVQRLFGVPYWAVAALAVSGALFVLEWFYLFHTPMAINDEELPELISELQAVETGSHSAAKEDE